MQRFFIALMVTLTLAACSDSKKDDIYYFSNPQALKFALQQCQGGQTKDFNCEHINVLALEFQQQAQELRMSPQQYGQKIIKLQNELSAIRSSQNDKKQPSLEKMQLKLDKYLAVVKVFESPAS